MLSNASQFTVTNFPERLFSLMKSLCQLQACNVPCSSMFIHVHVSLGIGKVNKNCTPWRKIEKIMLWGGEVQTCDHETVSAGIE